MSDCGFIFTTFFSLISHLTVCILCDFHVFLSCQVYSQEKSNGFYTSDHFVAETCEAFLSKVNQCLVI